MRITKRLAGGAMAVVGAIGGLVAMTPAPALAAPACVVTNTNSTVTARCTGVNSFRSDALCEENSGARYHAYGPWVGSGGTSTSRCHEYAYVVGRGANVR